VAALKSMFEAVVKAVVRWVQPVAALETVVEEMGLQSRPPMHLHTQ